MPVDLLVLGAAFLTGLLGSAHCAAMCGGIAVGLGGRRPLPGPWSRAVPSTLLANGGRIASYALAGALVGGLGGAALAGMDLRALGPWLRLGVGLVLVFAALRLAAPRWAARLAPKAGTRLWSVLAPLRERVPGAGPWRPLLLGALWGWLPCGLAYTLLTAAWLEGSALHGALLMAAFGLGTLPALAALGLSGARLGIASGARRWWGASLVGGAGLLTLASPWLVGLPALHAALAALGCRSLAG